MLAECDVVWYLTGIVTEEDTGFCRRDFSTVAHFYYFVAQVLEE